MGSIPIVKIKNDKYNLTNRNRLLKITPMTHTFFRHYRLKVILKMSENVTVHLGFCHGNKDDYAVFIHVFWCHQLHGIVFPYDMDLFNHIKRLIKYSNANVKQFFIVFDQIYNHTGYNINPSTDWTFHHLNVLNKNFPGYHWVSVMWCYLHLAMISEYRYRSKRGYPSRLQKRVKFIGISQLLLGHMTAYQASQFSRNHHVGYLFHVYHHYVRKLRKLFANKKRPV